MSSFLSILIDKPSNFLFFSFSKYSMQFLIFVSLQFIIIIDHYIFGSITLGRRLNAHHTQYLYFISFNREKKKKIFWQTEKINRFTRYYKNFNAKITNLKNKICYCFFFFIFILYFVLFFLY